MSPNCDKAKKKGDGFEMLKFYITCILKTNCWVLCEEIFFLTLLLSNFKI